MLSFVRAITGTLLLAVVVTWFGAAHAAGEAKKRAAKSQPSSDQKIYDLTVPWPFRAGRIAEDADGDGVADARDRCPATPRGAVVDANGCPKDSDRDGVPDGIDRCPDTARGARVGPDGCAADSDRDGVPDGVDQCADTPRGATVDAKGCPSDSDRDGVFDGIDKCADTPRELAVDKDGCPISIGEVGREFLDKESIAYNIEFASGKDEIPPQSAGQLDRVGEVLSEWTDAKVQITGHTDSQGSESLNRSLSLRRAEAVKVYLTRKFRKIDPKNLSTKGLGASKPIADNRTAEGRAKNRRVEFTLLNAKELRKEVDTRRYKRRSE